LVTPKLPHVKGLCPKSLGSTVILSEAKNDSFNAKPVEGEGNIALLSYNKHWRRLGYGIWKERKNLYRPVVTLLC